jgi:type II secretory pathway pseudopilin PulG
MDFFRQEPDVAAPVFDDSLQRMQRQRSTGVIIVVIVVIVGGAGLLFTLLRATAKNPLDEQMLEAGKLLERAVTYYYADNAEYPDSLRQVEQYFPTDRQWPTEPYRFQIIQDTGSREFSDPDSIGMVHYEKIDMEDKTGYRIWVFGRKGVLKVLWGGYVQEP